MVDTGGTVMSHIVYRRGAQWVQECDVTLPCGTKGRLENVATITDDGDTWTWTMNGKIGDDIIKDQKDVWRRVAE